MNDQSGPYEISAEVSFKILVPASQIQQDSVTKDKSMKNLEMKGYNHGKYLSAKAKKSESTKY